MIEEPNPFAELEAQQPPETQKWVVVLEKLIGIALLIMGGAMILALTFNSRLLHSDLHPESKSAQLKLFIVENWFVMVMAILFIYGGFLFLVKKKMGWFICLIGLIQMVFWSGFNFIKWRLSENQTFSEELDVPITLLILGLSAVVYFLCRKEMRQRYEVTKKDYMVVFFASVLLLTIRFISM